VGIDNDHHRNVLLSRYLFSGLALAAVCDVIFIKDGFYNSCLSPKEFALIAVAWPYYIFDALLRRD